MRIAHCQFETWCGDFDHNLRRVEEGLTRAEKERAEIVSFPECFLTGYPNTGEVARRDARAGDVVRSQQERVEFPRVWQAAGGGGKGVIQYEYAGQGERAQRFPNATEAPRNLTDARLVKPGTLASPHCRGLRAEHRLCRPSRRRAGQWQHGGGRLVLSRACGLRRQRHSRRKLPLSSQPGFGVTLRQDPVPAY